MESMENLFKGESNLDEAELVNDAMNNAYEIITGNARCEELLEKSSDRMALPFNPFERIDFNKVIDMLVRHYEEQEWYERCAQLINLKDDDR